MRLTVSKNIKALIAAAILSAAVVYGAGGTIKLVAIADIGWMEMRAGPENSVDKMQRAHFGPVSRGMRFTGNPGNYVCTRTGPNQNSLSGWNCRTPPSQAGAAQEFTIP